MANQFKSVFKNISSSGIGTQEALKNMNGSDAPCNSCAENHWSSIFSSVVSKAYTVEVLSTGVAGSVNGALQVICAEFQLPSPQVPIRECYFARYCKHMVDGTWPVVHQVCFWPRNYRNLGVSSCAWQARRD